MCRMFQYFLGGCLLVCQLSCGMSVKVAEERLLWLGGIKDNPVKYEQQNVMRIENYGNPEGPLGTCRVYSNVSVPTYFIYPSKPGKNTGVGMVVLPGGGYEDIWLDTRYNYHMSIGSLGSKMQHLATCLFLYLHQDTALWLSEPKEFQAKRFSSGSDKAWQIDFGDTENLKNILKKYMTFTWQF